MLHAKVGLFLSKLSSESNFVFPNLVILNLKINLIVNSIFQLCVTIQILISILILDCPLNYLPIIQLFQSHIILPHLHVLSHLV